MLGNSWLLDNFHDILSLFPFFLFLFLFFSLLISDISILQYRANGKLTFLFYLFFFKLNDAASNI